MKSPGPWVRWALLPVVLAAGCIAFDVEDSFCTNATTAQQQAICGGDAGSPGNPDAGVDASCGSSSSCNVPPSQCHESRGTCVSGKCEYPLKQTGASCNDATPDSACHGTSGTCEAGVCRSSLKPAGAACDDGQLCTTQDTCDSAGRCVGGSPFVCDAPPTQCHEAAGTCVNNTCTYKLAVGAGCNDGDKCTDSDKCNSAGICVGTARACPAPSNSCFQPNGTCDANSGACKYNPQPAGSACESGNLCTDDICDGRGNCAPDSVPVCADKSQFCLALDACYPATGCQYTYLCSGNQECRSGRCCTPRLTSASSGLPAEDCVDTPQPLQP